MYCVPLNHPKAKHYKMKNDVDFTRIFDGEKLMGVMNFNNMIPVDESVVTKMDLRIAKNEKVVSGHIKFCVQRNVIGFRKIKVLL
ncbi:MAG: type III toxin-antitoxin system ToxN/AbiQ family toxin [Lachnospiraceae bacterium]|nr:type III toxin-antitoxin system ToxN/AbiQ family toxin [Lachnospiraceae bacterium]